MIDYYQSTYSDYKNLWTGNRDLAIHFGYYDDKTKKHSDAVIRLNQVLAEYAKISKDDHVLDAGCGYGGSSIWLAQNIGCKVTGITIVPFQVEIGSREIQNRQLSDKVELLNQDFTNINFPNETFSVYWALESIVHAQDRSKVLSEAHRLLKKDGRLIVAEYTYREGPSLSKAELNYMNPWLNGWAMPQLLTKSEYERQLAEAGFKNIKSYDITGQVKPSLKRLKVLCTIFLPGAKLLRSLGIFNWQRTANVEGSLRQAKALDKGLWNYSIFVAEK